MMQRWLSGMIVAPPSQPLDPTKPFMLDGQSLGVTVADYWAWAHSGLLGNKERGVLAEFIVARALGITTPAHDPWGSFDLLSPAGTAIEVKSAAYLQAWNQRELSRPIWQSLRSRRSEATAEGGWWLAEARTVKGEILVLCLFSATDHAAGDPLDLDQWAFWLVPAAEVTTDTMSLSAVAARYRRLSFAKLRQAFTELEQSRLSRPAATSQPEAP